MYEKGKIIESVGELVFLYIGQSAQSIFCMSLRPVILALCLAILAGCTSLPQGPTESVNLPAQLEALRDITQWRVKGKMAMRQQQEGVSANLLWRHRPQEFRFKLTNLLGITLVDLTEDAGLVTLEADDQTFTDTDAQALIARVTGWQVPVAQLQDWIKGLPGPTDQYTLNDKQLLATLTPNCNGCGQWRVSYSHYGKVDQTWLPHALTLTDLSQPNTFIKIRIDQWTL